MDEPKPMGRNDGHKFDYSRITDQVFIGSDLCKGGVCLIHAEEFKRLGVSVEINLSQENNEVPPKNLLAYSWLPVVDGHAPSPEQLDIGSSIIGDVVESGNKIYVHCKNGHGRSPTLVAAYYIRYKGISPEEAQKLIASKRPEIHIEKVQLEALAQFSKKWSK